MGARRRKTGGRYGVVGIDPLVIRVSEFQTSKHFFGRLFLNAAAANRKAKASSG